MVLLNPPVLKGERHYPERGLPLTVVRDRSGAHPRHQHDFVEIVLVTKGRGIHLRYPPADENARDAPPPLRYELVENDVFLVPLKWSHGYEQREGLEFYNLLFSESLLINDPQGEKLFRQFAGTGPFDGTGLVYKLHLRPAQREAIEACLRTIMGETTARQPGYELLSKAKFMEAIVLLSRAATANEGPAGRSDAPSTGRAVPDAVTFMEDHLAEEITIQDVAAAANLSFTYFCEVFKQATGLSPGRYLTRLRLEHSKGLLLTSNIAVTDIALRSGFCDSSYYARVFKATIGCSPRAFRESGKLS